MSDSPDTGKSPLTLQLTPQNYHVLAEAATLTGLTISDYILHHALSSAISHVALHHCRPAATSEEQPSAADSSSESPQPQPSTQNLAPSSAPSSDVALNSLLDTDPQDINNLAKAILSTLAWSSSEIVQND